MAEQPPEVVVPPYAERVDIALYSLLQEHELPLADSHVLTAAYILEHPELSSGGMWQHLLNRTKRCSKYLPSFVLSGKILADVICVAETVRTAIIGADDFVELCRIGAAELDNIVFYLHRRIYCSPQLREYYSLEKDLTSRCGRNDLLRIGMPGDIFQMISYYVDGMPIPVAPVAVVDSHVPPTCLSLDPDYGSFWITPRGEFLGTPSSLRDGVPKVCEFIAVDANCRRRDYMIPAPIRSGATPIRCFALPLGFARHVMCTLMQRTEPAGLFWNFKVFRYYGGGFMDTDDFQEDLDIDFTNAAEVPGPIAAAEHASVYVLMKRATIASPESKIARVVMAQSGLGGTDFYWHGLGTPVTCIGHVECAAGDYVCYLYLRSATAGDHGWAICRITMDQTSSGNPLVAHMTIDDVPSNTIRMTMDSRGTVVYVYPIGDNATLLRVCAFDSTAETPKHSVLGTVSIPEDMLPRSETSPCFSYHPFIHPNGRLYISYRTRRGILLQQLGLGETSAAAAQ